MIAGLEKKQPAESVGDGFCLGRLHESCDLVVFLGG